MRAFLAIPAPEAFVSALLRVQDAIGRGRAVPPENLHLTLVFLGEVDDAPLEELHLALSGLRCPAPTLTLEGLDALDAGTQTVIAARVARDPALMGLQARVETAARRAGIDLPRRRFRPHITLVRMNGPTMRTEAHRLAALHSPAVGPALGSAPADGFALWRSTLSQAGARHDILADYVLSQPAD